MAIITRSAGAPSPTSLGIGELCWDYRNKVLYIGNGTGSGKASTVDIVGGPGAFDVLKGDPQTIEGNKQFSGGIDLASAKVVKVALLKTDDRTDAPVSAKLLHALLDAFTLPALMYLEDVVAFAGGLVGGGYVWAKPKKSYTIIEPLQIADSATFDGDGASFVAGAGATRLFKMSGWNPYLKEVYVADNRASSGAAVEINGRRLAGVQDLTVINAGSGAILLNDADGGSVARANLNDIHAEEITGIGIELRSTVFDTQATNLYLSGFVDYAVNGLGKPRAAVIGWSQVTPRVGQMPTGGGHQLTNVCAIMCGTGFKMVDAQLSGYSNCVADSCSGYGLDISGESWSLEFEGLYIGTSRGIRVAGTSTKIYFQSMHTEFNGNIPGWGAANFFDAPGPYYDVTVEDTASVIINGDAWRGDKRVNVAPTASLVVTGGEWWQGRNVTDIAQGTLVFLTEDGVVTTNEGDAGFRMPFDGYLFQMRFNVNDSAGAGESFTATARIGAQDTALTATIFEAAYASHAWGSVLAEKDQFITLGLRSSSGAQMGGRRFQVAIQLLAR